VLGATGGIGDAVLREVALEGAKPIASGRDPGKLARTAEHGAAATVEADVGTEEGRRRIVSAAPALDGLVYAAGASSLAPLRFTKDADYDALHEVNARAPLFLARDLAKAKKISRGASLVFVSSIAPHGGIPGYAAYAASKSALKAGARVLAAELAPSRTRVNCLAPGMIASALANGAAERMSEDAMERHRAAYPLGDGETRDVARAAVFLLSDDARWITGVTLPVDGGFSLT